MPANTIALKDFSEYAPSDCDGENSFYVWRWLHHARLYSADDGMLLSPKVKRVTKWNAERGYEVIFWRLYVDIEKGGDYASLVYFYDYNDRKLALKCLQGLVGLLIGGFNMGDWYTINGLRGWKVI